MYYYICCTLPIPTLQYPSVVHKPIKQSTAVVCEHTSRKLKDEMTYQTTDANIGQLSATRPSTMGRSLRSRSCLPDHAILTYQSC